MVVSRDEAVASLKEIQRAGQKMGRLKSYSHSAPHFIIWGLVWVIANSATDLLPAPGPGGWAWPACLVLGAIASFVTGLLTSPKRSDSALEAGAGMQYGSRFGVLAAVFFFFFLCLFIIHPLPNMRVGNAVVSIFFPFIYMAVGVFAGWRLFAIGAVTAALIMIGWLYIHEHLFLWMGVVAGGSLILGGLWLRKA
jgi:hypothetical protein